jgi:aryl-alcohol dehydrogenase-like predicted oxidoreductase
MGLFPELAREYPTNVAPAASVNRRRIHPRSPLAPGTARTKKGEKAGEGGRLAALGFHSQCRPRERREGRVETREGALRKCFCEL